MELGFEFVWGKGLVLSLRLFLGLVRFRLMPSTLRKESPQSLIDWLYVYV